MEIKEISTLEYDKFAIQRNQNHFMHSSKWGKFRQTIGWEYKTVGLFQEEKLIAAALLLSKKVKIINKKIYYIPRGLIIDYTNKEHLQEFMKSIKKYITDGIMIKIDPDIKYNNLDAELNIISANEIGHQVHQNLLDVGFKHKGFLNNFEGMIPRHTIRVKTDDETIESYTQKLGKKTKQRIKQGAKQGLVIENATKEQLPIFMKLLEETSERDEFTYRAQKYYEDMFDVFGEKVLFTLAKIDYTKMLNKLNTDYNNALKEAEKIKNKILSTNMEEISEVNKNKTAKQQQEIQNRIEKLKNSITAATADSEKFPEGKYIAGNISLIDENKMWYLFSATSNSYREYAPAYALVNNMINYSIEHGYQFYDLFGISGDNDPQNHLYGLYSFKSHFNGEACEFIGEYDYVLNSLLYSLFEIAFPKWKNFKKNKK